MLWNVFPNNSYTPLQNKGTRPSSLCCYHPERKVTMQKPGVQHPILIVFPLKSIWTSQITCLRAENLTLTLTQWFTGFSSKCTCPICGFPPNINNFLYFYQHIGELGFFFHLPIYNLSFWRSHDGIYPQIMSKYLIYYKKREVIIYTLFQVKLLHVFYVNYWSIMPLEL